MALPLIPILLAGGLFMVASAGAKKRGVTTQALSPEQAARKVVGENPGGDPQQLALQAYHVAWPGCPLPEDFHPDNPDHMVCVSYLAQMLALVMAAQQGAPIGEEPPPPPPTDGDLAELPPNVWMPMTVSELEATYSVLQEEVQGRFGLVGVEYQPAYAENVRQAAAAVAPAYPQIRFFMVGTVTTLQYGLYSEIGGACPADALAAVKGFVGTVDAGLTEFESAWLCWEQGALNPLVAQIAQQVAEVLQ